MAGQNALGTFEAHGDYIDVRFERYYPRSVETVWRALTDPARLADWMGPSQVEPRVGGRVEMMGDLLHPMTGRVLAWEPPSVLAFTWSNTHAQDSVVRYELIPDAGGTKLIFSHQGMPYKNSALMLPGWHDFFDRLRGVLEGFPPTGEMNFRTMQATYIDHYQLQGVRLEP